MAAAVLLVDPKFPHNVGNALRACALLDAHVLAWTGYRVPDPERIVLDVVTSASTDLFTR
jgi:tRNA(Leu) C34 or U34 (ribose-2'-O)-methylase TrmL